MIDPAGPYAASQVIGAPALSLDVATEIRRLVTGTGLSVLFQPVFDLAAWLEGEKRIVGVEALARFEGGEGPDFWFRQASLHGLRIELEEAL